jgi:pyruvate-formate lyase
LDGVLRELVNTDEYSRAIDGTGIAYDNSKLNLARQRLAISGLQDFESRAHQIGVDSRSCKDEAKTKDESGNDPQASGLDLKGADSS